MCESRSNYWIVKAKQRLTSTQWMLLCKMGFLIGSCPIETEFAARLDDADAYFLMGEEWVDSVKGRYLIETKTQPTTAQIEALREIGVDVGQPLSPTSFTGNLYEGAEYRLGQNDWVKSVTRHDPTAT